MAEEVRFFLRTAIYAGLIAIVYWFASFEPDAVPYRYDAAGTALLAACALSAASIVVVVLLVVRGARAARGDVVPPAGGGPSRMLGAVNRVIGLEHGSAERVPQPLAGGPDAIPSSSAWPVLVAVAATLVALGLVFGPWLWVPGGLVGVGAVWGWLTQLD